MLFLDVTVQHVFLNGLFAAPPPRKMTLANEYFGEACPASAPFFGFMGAAAALIFASEFFCRVWFSARSGFDLAVGWGVIKPCLQLQFVLFESNGRAIEYEDLYLKI